MHDRRISRSMLCLIVLAMIALHGVTASAPVASAAPPWSKFVTFKRIEAKQGEAYPIGEEQGPWLILATTFQGPDAQRDAQALVYELRKDYKLNAYTHQKTYDYSKGFVGRGVDKYGNPRRMRHQSNNRVEEVAVMVGDFVSIDDSKAKKTLDRIKAMRPKTLDPKGQGEGSQSFAAIRRLHEKVWGGGEDKTRGPMRMAFVIPNPLLPKEYFKPKGVDKFVEKLNADRPFSLLKCPKAYTVRIATYTGGTTTKIKKNDPSADGAMATSRLDMAAKSADRLTEKLRAKGVEAYVFHDRSQSIVTVGSFDSHGAQRMSDGSVRFNPAIQTVISNFSAIRPGGSAVQQASHTSSGRNAQWRNQLYDAEVASNVPGLGSTRYRTFDGTPLDIQPTVIDVPKRSIASDYAAGLPRLFR